LMVGAENLRAGMDGLVIGNFIMNLFLSGSLNSLWTLVNTLQMIVHIAAINVKTAPNAAFFMGELVSITQFDIIPENQQPYLHFWLLLDGSYSDTIA